VGRPVPGLHVKSLLEFKFKSLNSKA
jgi:hypothetical protein